MKKLLFAFFIMVPMLAFGQLSKKPVQCFSTENFLYTIDTEYKEKPIFFYRNAVTQNKTIIIMFQNKETGSWTLIEMIGEYSCVLATGKENVF
jgi:hypothetical protein